MTLHVITVGKDQNLGHAKELMYQHGIRHLPVLDGGRLYGVLSDRDIKLAFAVDGVSASQLKISEACTTDVYAVPPSEPVKQVAAYMASHSIGCCVIAEHDKVQGIFTVIDACKLLSQIL